MSAAPRRVDTEAYVTATATAREVRAVVAEQLRELVIESDRMSSRTELSARIERLLFVERRLTEARAREAQAREVGNPVARAVQDQREFVGLRREAIMGIAVACAGWVAAEDYELARAEVEDA